MPLNSKEKIIRYWEIEYTLSIVMPISEFFESFNSLYLQIPFFS